MEQVGQPSLADPNTWDSFNEIVWSTLFKSPHTLHLEGCGDSSE
jgi:hypothetical protein